MTLPTRQLVLSALFGAALAAAPVTAQDPAKGGTGGQADPKKDDPPDVKVQLKTLQDDVRALQSFRKIMEDIVQGKADGPATGPDAGLVKRLADLDAAVKRIDEALKRIEAALNDPTRRTAAFGPSATTARTQVRIVNEYPTVMSMIVNGRVRRVDPGATELVEVAPGSFTYELLADGQRAVTSTIKEGETVTLRIR